MSRTRAFTLMELMVTVAIIAIIAAVALPIARSALRNASVSATGFDLQVRLEGLKTQALRDQHTLLAVLVDAPGNDGRDCLLASAARCTSLFVLRDPSAAWKLSNFDPDSPGVEAEVEEVIPLGRGIRFAAELETRPATAPVPFQKVVVFDPAFRGACKGRKCVAVRFSRSGEVSGELPAPDPTLFQGMAFAIGSEVGGNGDVRALFVSFPSGIVKGFGVFENYVAPPAP